METATFFDAVADPGVERLEASLRRRNLLLDPCTEIEGVVEDLEVCGTRLDLLEQTDQICLIFELDPIEPTDISNGMDLLSLFQEGFCTDSLYKAQGHEVAVVRDGSRAPLQLQLFEMVPVGKERSL